jgi:hypothetical protein
MKNLLLAGALCAFLTTSLVAADDSLLDKDGNPAGFRTLAIGDAAPDFTLPGIDGRNWSLKDFAKHDILMVLFTSNHCPTSHGIEERLKKLRADLEGKSVGLVAINPNHPDGIRLDELGFGEFGDSFEEMKPYAEQQGWDFPYLTMEKSSSPRAPMGVWQRRTCSFSTRNAGCVTPAASTTRATPTNQP